MPGKRIVIIGGAGKMGKWLAGFLREGGHQVIIADRNEAGLREIQREFDIETASSNNAAIAAADYILLSVPIEEFEGVVAELGPRIETGQTVIDITSTKTVPVEVMHRYIKSGQVLGGHPLFGPGARNIENKNIVLTPTNDTEKALAYKISAYLGEKGARVDIMSPKEHDEMMSLVLGLSHFIALVAADTLLSSGKLRPMEAAGSSTYKVLLTLIESVLSEDPELYASIQMSLPHVTDFESLFREKTGEWADLVAVKDRAEFARRMREMKQKLTEVAPDFVKSYENVYRIVEGL